MGEPSFDYDPCEDCRICGDNYFYEDGELMSRCPECPLNTYTQWDD